MAQYSASTPSAMRRVSVPVKVTSRPAASGDAPGKPPLIEVLDGLADPAAPPPGLPLASQLSAWARKHGPEADPATALRAVLAWSRLHGFVSLEIAGDCASMNIDPDQVFEIQLATLTA